MACADAYTPLLRASICPPVLKRTATAKSVYTAAAPCDRPVTPSIDAAFCVASNWTGKEPICVATAVFCQVVDAVVHDHGDRAGTTVRAAVPIWHPRPAPHTD